MYGTGPIEGVAILGDTIRISGGSTCTGIGAGANVPFSAIIQKGGPGATVVLTVGQPSVALQMFPDRGFAPRNARARELGFLNHGS
jgi:hypothetical protein